LDLYGEVVDAVSACYDESAKLSRDERRFVQDLVRFAANHWHEADAGIWEVRSEHEDFIESKVMCWLAVSRGADLVRRRIIRGDAARLRSVADEIQATVRLEGLDSRRDVFRKALRRDGLDAALLRLPMCGFADARESVMSETIDAVSRELEVDALVYRREIDRERGEGAFVICSFWLVDCLARQGRIGEARDRFERLLSYANDLGLYSEEIDPRTASFLGNFPLAFSHVGLINAAVTLGRAEARA
jgi:GH15 family glucan-1,4-alpha-glucosidase